MPVQQLDDTWLLEQTSYPLPRFNPDDLINTYVAPTSRHDLMGSKAWFGQYTDLAYAILRLRYLLSTDVDEHLEALFLLPQLAEQVTWADRGPVAAAWLAGLQKNRAFLPQILTRLNTPDSRYLYRHDMGSYGYYGAASWHIALLLFEDPTLYKPLLTACHAHAGGTAANARNIEDFRALALATLELFDQLFGTRHAAQAPNDIDESAKQRLRTRLEYLLALSDLLRCGIAFETPTALRLQLHAFNASAMPMAYQAAGVCKPPRVRAYCNTTHQEIEAHQQFKLEAQTWAKAGIRVPDGLVKLFYQQNPGIHQHSKPRPKRALGLLSRHTEAWLSHGGDDFWLRAVARSADDAFDIVAALEQDIHYRLPIDIVALLYDKLTNLVNVDAELYREYAFGLLLRGNQFDAKAKELLEKAAMIEQGQQKLAYYPAISMPSGWQPRFNFPNLALAPC
ncbi:hypothetical protein [Chitinimonas sp. JJ19]|uniref:hypothetical protein n=1 Tax=Chitinimonas sp. JJ19 TaxID=3109352 RepID=UPI0030025189